MRWQGLLACALLASLVATDRGWTAPLGFVAVLDAPGVGGTSGVAASPDGRNLYTTTGNDGVVGAPMVVVFSRESDGSLVFVEAEMEGLAGGDSPLCGATSPIVSPDGRHVYVSTPCAIEAEIQVFTRDDATGKLSRQPGGVERVPDGIDGIVYVDAKLAISPDGRHLYVGDASLTNEIGIYERNADTGVLTWVGGLEPEFGTARQREIGSIAVSPDGRNVYVSQEDSLGDDDRLLVYARDAQSGGLVLLQTITDGADGFAVLNDLYTIVVSPDGRHVYAGPFRDPVGLMVVFSRDQATGRLTVVQTLSANDRIRGRSLGITPSGGLLVAGQEDVLSVFARDLDTGRLSLLQQVKDGDPGVDGLRLIGGLLGRGLGIPDDAHVYVAAAAGLLRFDVGCGNGHVESDEACDDGNAADGDGCSARCEVEPCFACDGDPSACVPLDATPCDDGNACTTTGLCSAGVCVPGEPLADGSPCDDGDACSVDDLCAAGRCMGGEARECDVCSRCDRRLGCVGFLETGCFASAELGRHGRLGIEERRAGGARLVWRWATPHATHTRDDLGDPSADVDYAFCVFDRRDLPFGLRRQRRVVAAFQIPAGGDCSQDACWARRGDGYRYRFRGTGSGVRHAKLRAGAPTSKLSLKARGDVDTLPLELPAMAQLRASSGACWETAYDQFVERNGANAFRARGGLEVPCRPKRSSSCQD